MRLLHFEIRITSNTKAQMSEIKEYITKQSNRSDALDVIREMQEATKELDLGAGLHTSIDDEPWKSQNVHVICKANANIYYWTDTEKSVVYVIAVIYVGQTSAEKNRMHKTRM